MKKHALIILLCISVHPLFSQVGMEQIQIYGSRDKKPIEVVVETVDDKVNFYAVNQSHYRFDVSLEINDISNLSPAAFSRTFSVGFGKTPLTTFSQVSNEQGISFRHSYRYWLKESDVADSDFFYLHPVGMDRYISYCNPPGDNFKTSTEYYPLLNNDTVFAMRKGCVVVDNKKLTVEYRLYKEGSLEILHDDGTVMVYTDFNKEDESFLKRGQEVFPGQPLFINRSGDRILKIGLFRISNNFLEGIQPVFNCCNNLEKSDSCKVSYSSELITREMSKMEIRRYTKGKLY